MPRRRTTNQEGGDVSKVPKKKIDTAVWPEVQRTTTWMTEDDIRETWAPGLFGLLTADAEQCVLIDGNGEPTLHYLVVTGVKPYVLGNQWQ